MRHAPAATLRVEAGVQVGMVADTPSPADSGRMAPQ